LSIRNLDRLLRPRSVALVGASRREGSLGATVLEKLTSAGFAGPIYAVNPNAVGQQGAIWQPDVASLPEPPDLAVITTPPAAVPGVVAELAARGVPAAAVVTAGITERSGLRSAMLAAARPHTMRIIGPNCLGVLMPHERLNASFAHINATPGRLAFISQSGALVTSMLDWATTRLIGFSGIVSLGDMADVDFGDLVDLFAADPTTDAILLYVEGITAPAKFISAARAAARLKPVIAIKAGRSAAGGKAAASHTGAMAGAYDVYQAVFRRAGVIAVETLTELFDAAATLGLARRLAGDRLAIVTNGGGAGVLAVDAMDSSGRLAELAPATLTQLDAELPATWSHANPVDLIGDARSERYASALDAVLADPGTDAALVMNCPTAMASSEEIAEAVADRVAARDHGTDKPVIACWLGDGNAGRARPALAAARVPVFETPDDAMRGFAYMVAARRGQEALLRAPAEHHEVVVDGKAARRAIDSARAAGRDILDELEAKALLAAYGIRVVPTRFAPTAAAVSEACRELPPPYVVKIVSPQITHKSDVGGVMLNLPDPEAAAAAAAGMARRIALAHPSAEITGFSVQSMIRRPGAHEMIAGVADDPTFGPMLLVGAGGKAAELLNDKALGLPPLDLELARAMIEETRISRLLAGYRDEPPADVIALAGVLLALSQMTIDLPELCELDINPLLVDAKGLIALDARVRIARDKAGGSRLVIRPVPLEWARELATDAGRCFLVRPVRPDDAEALGRFYAELADADRSLRFLSPLRRLSPQLLAAMTQIDYRRAMNFLAFDGPDGEDVIATAELFADPDFDRAEVAITVRSDLKAQGIGRALMQHLIEYATAEGIGRLEGTVRYDNKRMIDFARRSGAELIRRPADHGLLTVIKPLR
jgi:acetyltransferase